MMSAIAATPGLPFIDVHYIAGVSVKSTGENGDTENYAPATVIFCPREPRPGHASRRPLWTGPDKIPRWRRVIRLEPCPVTPAQSRARHRLQAQAI